MEVSNKAQELHSACASSSLLHVSPHTKHKHHALGCLLESTASDITHLVANGVHAGNAAGNAFETLRFLEKPILTFPLHTKQ